MSTQSRQLTPAVDQLETTRGRWVRNWDAENPDILNANPKRIEIRCDFCLHIDIIQHNEH